MWTIIKTANEYDCVPNSWLVDSTTCRYPDRSPNTLKRLARDQVAPPADDSWNIIEMEIIRRDLENFDRCMSDVVRLSKGRCTLTESEKENRGKTFRDKKRKKISHGEPIENESSGSEDEQENKTKKKKKKLNGIRPTGQAVDQGHQNLQETSHKLCKLRNSVHYCVQKDGPADTSTIADGLCALSRSINLMKSYFTEQFELIKSQINSQHIKSGQPSSAVDTMPPISDEETDKLVAEWFPISDLKQFENLEMGLKDADFREKIVRALTTLGAGSSSSSRALTWMLRNSMSADLTSMFSWSGQKKMTMKKMAFNETNFQKVLFSAVRRRFKVPDDKIEKSVKTWLQQTAYDLLHGEKKKKQSLCAEVDEDGTRDDLNLELQP